MMQVHQYDERRARLARSIGQDTYAERGVSLVELMIVVIITMIISAIAIPSVMTTTQNFRIQGDVRDISAQIFLARMIAASHGVQSRLNCSLTANTCQIETNNSGTWQLQGGVHYFATGDSFGYGSITAPAGQQTTIAQTTPIYLNSRGIATTSSGTATGSSAIYLTNTKGQYFAVAVSIAGQPTVYMYSGSAWVPF